MITTVLHGHDQSFHMVVLIRNLSTRKQKSNIFIDTIQYLQTILP